MSATHVNASLVAIGTAGIVLGVRLAAWPLVSVAVPPGIGTPPAALAIDAPGQPDSLGAAVVARDPFRATRRPSPVLYDPVRIAQPAVPRPPMPPLALVGMAWDGGRDPTALIDGLPGIDGPRPLRRGETLAGLTVKSIRPDRVVITGLDSVWTLSVTEPWR